MKNRTRAIVIAIELFCVAAAATACSGLQPRVPPTNVSAADMHYPAGVDPRMGAAGDQGGP